MTQPVDLLLNARPEELADALQHGLRYDGRRRVHDADEFMARLVAERLVAHLLRCGFVLMRRPAPGAPDSSRHPHPHRRIEDKDRS